MLDLLDRDRQRFQLHALLREELRNLGFRQQVDKKQR
jgi:hypothetical protein